MNGINIIKSIVNDKKIYNASLLKLDDVINLLSELPNDSELCFFDHYHPQWSDPGAYVCVKKYGDSFIYMLGNHGWSSKWYFIDINRLCRYIMKNKEYQIDNFYTRMSSKNSLLIKEKPVCESYWFNKLLLLYEYENKYAIYEVNGYHIILLLLSNICYAIEEEDEIYIDNKEFEYIFNYYSRNSTRYIERIVKIHKP